MFKLRWNVEKKLHAIPQSYVNTNTKTMQSIHRQVKLNIYRIVGQIAPSKEWWGDTIATALSRDALEWEKVLIQKEFHLSDVQQKVQDEN